MRNLWRFHSACVDRSDKICAIFMIRAVWHLAACNLNWKSWLTKQLSSPPLSFLNILQRPLIVQSGVVGGGGGGGDGGCCSEYCINDHSYNCILSLSLSLSLVFTNYCWSESPPFIISDWYGYWYLVLAGTPNVVWQAKLLTLKLLTSVYIFLTNDGWFLLFRNDIVVNHENSPSSYLY